MSNIQIYQDKNQVIKNNDFIRCGDLTALQRKSFAILLKDTIENIIETGTRKNYYYMTLTTYRDLMGHPDNMPTKYIFNELNELTKKQVKWGIDGKGHGTVSVLLAGFEIEKNQIKWAFSPFLTDKILDDGYTPLQVKYITALNSKYAIALYENLQMWKDRKWVKYNLTEFRELMGIAPDEYLKMAHIKEKVIDIALRDINKYTDMKLFFEQEKEGAKITHFRFYWENLSKKDIEKRDKEYELNERYLDAHGHKIGNKYKLLGVWFTLTKDGLKKPRSNGVFANFTNSILLIQEKIKNKEIDETKDIIKKSISDKKQPNLFE